MVLRNDTFAVLRAGTDRSWGVGVVCGTGLNCAAVSPDGRTVRYAAIGEISGDGGGGDWMGLQALRAAIRGRDRRGPRTVLEQRVPAHFGLRTPNQLMEAIYLDRIDQHRLTELPRLVFACSRDGDAAAQDIVDRLADEIVAMVVSALRRLRMTRSDADVVLGGGVARSRDARLLGPHPRAACWRWRRPPGCGWWTSRRCWAPPCSGLTRSARSGEHTREARAALTHDRITQPRRER